MLNNRLPPAPSIPKTTAKRIANDPYNSGLSSESFDINFEKKFKFSKFTISVSFSQIQHTFLNFLLLLIFLIDFSSKCLIVNSDTFL